MGTTSSPTVGYRLKAGDNVLAEGTAKGFDGKFSTSVSFANTCCIEMMLEVFDPATGMMVEIPVTYPEPS